MKQEAPELFEQSQVDDETAAIRDKAIESHKIRYRNAKGRTPPQTHSVVLYARFSPRPDSNSCESIKWQLDLLRKHAESKGWKIVAVCEDAAESGADINRPGLWSAVSKARYPGHAILVHRLDRLARDRYLFAAIEHELAKAGAAVISASGEGNGDSPEDDMIRGIVVLIADFHRRMMNARTSAATQYRLMTGGPSPSQNNIIGLIDDVNGPFKPNIRDPKRITYTRRIPCPHDWPIVVKLFELKDKGLGVMASIRALERKGIKFKYNPNMHRMSIYRILKRRRHVYVALSKHYADYLKERGMEPVLSLEEKMRRNIPVRDRSAVS